MQHFGIQYVFKKFPVMVFRKNALTKNFVIHVYTLWDARIKKNSGRQVNHEF